MYKYRAHLRDDRETRAELGEGERGLTKQNAQKEKQLDLYTILFLPILCGRHYNNGGSGKNVMLHNSVGDDRGVGCLNKEWVRRE